jgi:hypothetical protein
VLHIYQCLKKHNKVFFRHELLFGANHIDLREKIESDISVIELVIDCGVPQDRV